MISVSIALLVLLIVLSVPTILVVVSVLVGFIANIVSGCLRKDKEL